MRIFGLALLCAATLMASGPVSAEQINASLRAPTGKWVIDYAEHQCTASRAYGTAADPFHLIIKPSPGGEVTQIALVEKGQNFQGSQQDVALTLSGERKLTATQLIYGVNDKRFRLINLDPAQTKALTTSISLHWAGPGRAAGDADALGLGPMTGVMAILEDCRRDLRKYWSVGKEHENGRISGPRAERPLTSLFSANDYPSQASSRDQQGITAIILLIDETGTIRDCMVEMTSGIASLDINACLVIRKNGKFSPGLDRAGKPAKGAFWQRIKWVLPDE